MTQWTRFCRVKKIEPSAKPGATFEDKMRISAHRGRRFSLVVDAVSASSWTTWLATKSMRDTAGGRPRAAWQGLLA